MPQKDVWYWLFQLSHGLRLLFMSSGQEIHTLQVLVEQLGEKLEHVGQELKHSQQAQTEFLSRMSHELNSPLSVIIGFSQLLETSNLTEDQRDSLKGILDAANFLNQQNQHLFKLAVAKNTTVNLEPVAVKYVIDDALQRFDEIIEKKAITIDVGSRLYTLTLNADAHYLEQVLSNLVMNAIHYSNHAGTVSLDVDEQEGAYKISINDQGAGIPKQLYSNVFTLFHDQNVDNNDGLGMGLYLAKEYVELMGGEIGFNSVDGQGTTFWISLPRTDNDTLSIQ